MNAEPMSDQPRELRRYLHALETALAAAPEAARTEILADVRAHAADALDDGRTVEEVLQGLGAAEDVAAQYRLELDLPVREARETADEDPTAPNAAVAERASRMLHVASVAVAVLTGALAVFLQPAYTVSAVSAGSSSAGTIELGTRSETVFEHLGAGAALLALMPALLALLPLILPRTLRQPFAIANAVVIALLSLLGGLTVGPFYLPLAVMMWAAAVVPWRIRHGLDLSASPLWRIFGGVLVAAPGLLIVSGLVSGAVMRDWASLAAALAALALGLLFALGVRLGYALIAALGLAVLLLAMLQPGMMIITFWWAGGAYLAIGLSAVATLRPKRPEASA